MLFKKKLFKCVKTKTGNNQTKQLKRNFDGWDQLFSKKVFPVENRKNKYQSFNRNNRSQNIRDKLKFLCGILHYGKSSISVLQEIFSSTDKIFISGGGLRTRQ